MESKQAEPQAFDASIILGANNGLVTRGIHCTNPKVKDYIQSKHLDWMGTWQHDTLWCYKRGIDLVVEYLINAGFNVE